MTYGYEAQERDDRMIDASKRMNKFGTEKVLPGALLVNYLPFRMLSLAGPFRGRIAYDVPFSTPHPRMAAMA